MVSLTDDAAPAGPKWLAVTGFRLHKLNEWITQMFLIKCEFFKLNSNAHFPVYYLKYFIIRTY